MSLVVFTDPRTASTYTWEVNPTADNEHPLMKPRTIERTSKTGNVGAVHQQGDDGPLIIDWMVTVTSPAMELALWQWYVLCKSQTIYVTDWQGEEYEGQIIYLSRERKAGATPYAIYEVQIEVYRLISGILATAGVTA
ncbi:MAG TPA: hypothetical protein VN803_03625 [Gemmatimonadales bacterium]|nr:hypothetical protein [Gemmatimonadales bacterium]